MELGETAMYETEVYCTQWFDTASTTYKDSLIGPAPNTTVLLLDTNYVPYRFKLTDTEGNFSFSKLPFDHFIIYPEKAGLATSPGEITILEEEPELFGLHFTIRETDIFFELTDVNEYHQVDYAVYPNPIQDYLYIDLGIHSYSKTDVMIFNAAGQKVYSLNHSLVDGQILKIPVSDLPNGFYILDIVFDKQFRFSKKLIK